MLQSLKSGVRHRGHQQTIRSGEHCADGGFAWSKSHRDSAHVHGVCHDQSVKAQLLAQHPSENIL